MPFVLLWNSLCSSKSGSGLRPVKTDNITGENCRNALYYSTESMHKAWFSMYLRKYCRFQLFRFFRIYGSTGLCGDPRTRLQVMPGHRTGFSVRYIGKSRGSLTCSFNASILHRLSLFFFFYLGLCFGWLMSVWCTFLYILLRIRL